MPLFNLECQLCGKAIRRICTVQEARMARCDCGGELKRQYQPPNHFSKESLDNGLMGRSLERFTDAEEVFHNLDKRDKEGNDS